MVTELAAPPAIVADNLTIRYPAVQRGLRRSGAARGHTAIDGLSLSLSPGDRLGLLGRNGSGKSTLLRALAGVFPPVAGALEVRGSVAAIFNAALGFVPAATGRENIYLRGAMLGFTFPQIEALMPEIIAFSELEDWIDQPIEAYSSGMKLRLAFSITTAVRSDILLLDEWLGAGDSAFLDKARKRMQQMVEDSSIVVLATHNTSLMQSQCTQAIVLDGGKLAFHGDTDEAIEFHRRLPKPTKV